MSVRWLGPGDDDDGRSTPASADHDLATGNRVLGCIGFKAGGDGASRAGPAERRREARTRSRRRRRRGWREPAHAERLEHEPIDDRRRAPSPTESSATTDRAGARRARTRPISARSAEPEAEAADRGRLAPRERARVLEPEHERHGPERRQRRGERQDQERAGEPGVIAADARPRRPRSGDRGRQRRRVSQHDRRDDERATLRRPAAVLDPRHERQEQQRDERPRESRTEHPRRARRPRRRC